MDCPNNADERHCRDIRAQPNDPKNRVNGIWQSKRFSVPLTTKQNATDIRESFNYDDGVLLNDEIVTEYNNDTFICHSHDFHIVAINNNTWITVRNEELIEPNITTPENCHRAFVKCF